MRNSDIQRIQSATNQLTKCEICFEPYTCKLREPLLICSMHHTVCRVCMASIAIKKQCPFCREQINLNKITRNKYIYQLLREDPNEPEPKQINNNEMANYYQGILPLHNELVELRELSENEHSDAPQPSMEDNLDSLEMSNSEDEYEQCCCQLCDLECCNTPVWLYYLLFFVLQTPFIVLDMYYGSISLNGVCNDWSRNNHNIVVLQGWLFGISIVGMVLVGLGMLVGLCRLLQMDREIALVMEMVIGFLLLVKFLVYSIAELNLFFGFVLKNCSGGIYGYFVVETVLSFAFFGFLSVLACLQKVC